MGYYGQVVRQAPPAPPVPGGNNGEVQFNNAGMLSGAPGLIFDIASGTLSANGRLRAGANLATSCITEPPDFLIANGELAIWYDLPNGRVAYKAKDAGGTVVTGFLTMH